MSTTATVAQDLAQLAEAQGPTLTYHQPVAAERLGMSKRSMNRALRALAEEGRIRYVPGTGRTETVVTVNNV